MNDANAAQSGARGFAQEGAETLARLVAAQAVQVELGLQHPDAAAQLPDHVDADAAPPKRQGVVGVEQGLGVELVGDRFQQHRRFVALALFGFGLRARPLGRGGRGLAQGHDVADAAREERSFARFAGRALLLGGGRDLDGAALFEQRGAQGRQVLQPTRI